MGNVLKYNDVKQRLLRYVFENRLKEGDKLPSERKLCALFGTSNLPLRRAEDELCDGGMLWREKQRGVFIGRGWDRTSYSTCLGILSVGVNNYPSGPAEEELRDALREHLCDLRVIRTSGRNVSSVAVRELEKCDYIILSGFVTQAWVETIKSLEKPCLHVGYTELETGIPRLENDFVDMFEKVFDLSDELKAKRLLVWLSPDEELTYARALEEGLEKAMASRRVKPERVIREKISARSMRDALKSLQKHEGEFDMIVLRDFMLGTAIYLPEWRTIVDGRPVVVMNTSMAFPADFDQLPNIYRLTFPTSLLKSSQEFFFERHNRLPGGVMVKRHKAVLAKKPETTDSRK